MVKFFVRSIVKIRSAGSLFPIIQSRHFLLIGLRACPIGQFTNNWTQAQLNQAVSGASSLHLVLSRGGSVNSSSYQPASLSQQNTTTGGATYAQPTQNPKINASAKGFGAPQPTFRVSII